MSLLLCPFFWGPQDRKGDGAHFFLSRAAKAFKEIGVVQTLLIRSPLPVSC